jgi:hypothetical protein
MLVYAWNPSLVGGRDKESHVQDQPGQKCESLSEKKKKKKTTGGMGQLEAERIL